MVKTSVQIHDNLMEKLIVMEARQQREKSGIINEAVREYIEREERRQLLEETQIGLADIQAGRVIDGEKVMAWLESWGNEHELEPPQFQ
jgi:predicted transcriptional regulator